MSAREGVCPIANAWSNANDQADTKNYLAYFGRDSHADHSIKNNLSKKCSSNP
jgi:hypothetical protein